MRIYLAGKMTGLPYFNAHWFDGATVKLRSLPGITEVCNPVEHDRELGFEPLRVSSGSLEEAAALGFRQDVALGWDWTWIARYADCVVAGPSWTDSPGAISEVACAQALRRPVYEYGPFLRNYGGLSLLACALPPIMELGGQAGKGIG